MSVNPEYYYNLSGNITDGKKEYSLRHKEDKIGGLSISSGLKENYIEYGTNSLLDLLNELNNENKSFKAEIEQLKKCYNNVLDEMDTLAEVNDKTYKENKELKKENQHIKNTIKEMLDNERTEIEKSVLKQLWEIIQ